MVTGTCGPCTAASPPVILWKGVHPFDLRRPAAALAAALLACSGRPPPPPPAPSPTAEAAASPTPAADAGAGPGPGAAPAAPASPAALPVTAAVAVSAGQEQPLAREGRTVVVPAAEFRVEVAVHLTDARLLLLDAQDAMVASSGTSEVGAGATRLRLTPDEPLRPGSDYALRVDGAAKREVHDAAGRAYAPLHLELRAAGEKPAAPPRQKRRPRRDSK